MDPSSFSSDAAWRHICGLYADPALAAELLRRQDQQGLDVVLHLFALWAAQQGRPLDAAALAQADAHVARWRQEVIAPLRRLRRAMKAMDEAQAGAGAATRRQLQAAELAAERAELELLCAWLRER
ncbi:TIGR02444 family protein [Xylophilus sp. ASV27]|uniref:TIGR02444 family protein n=1 Tax=Xylophilus sp. ASV27 TaxID=2795129 RepID=UPI0018ED31D7|nr:TIGR02444 family protein [Xylophilus sp. ASV27]